MRQLNNGWYVPEGDTKMTRHLETDKSPTQPQYEIKQRNTIKKWHPERDVFLDVGANVGVWSIDMSTHFNRVISFEPSKRNKECLDLNIVGKAEVREVALSNFEGTAQFHEEIKNCGNSKLWQEEQLPGLYDVNVSTIDKQNLDNCNLIKIDVQGYEWQVIQGAEKTIEQFQPWIAFEVSADVDVICKFLEDRGYDMIDNKSKRLFIYAPLKGKNAPMKEAFGRRMGPGPYITLLPQDKQDIAKARHS